MSSGEYRSPAEASRCTGPYKRLRFPPPGGAHVNSIPNRRPCVRCAAEGVSRTPPSAMMRWSADDGHACERRVTFWAQSYFKDPRRNSRKRVGFRSHFRVLSLSTAISPSTQWPMTVIATHPPIPQQATSGHQESPIDTLNPEFHKTWMQPDGTPRGARQSGPPNHPPQQPPVRKVMMCRTVDC